MMTYPLITRRCAQFAFLLCLIFAALAGCQKPLPSKAVKIVITSSNENREADAKVITFDVINLEQPNISSGKVGDTLVFEIARPIFAVLQIGDKRYPVYLEQGFEMTFEGGNRSPLFTGDGADVNNYLSAVASLRSTIDNAGGRNIFDLDVESFLQRYDSIKSAVSNFRQHYFDSVKVASQLKSLIERRDEMMTIGVKQGYGWNYGANRNFELPHTLSLEGQIPFDSLLLSSNTPEYALMLHMFMHQEILIPVSNKVPRDKDGKPLSNLTIGVRDQIVARDYPPFLEEFLLAKNVEYWLLSSGPGNYVDSIYSQFCASYPNSAYLTAIQKRIDIWAPLAAGKKAPQFGGVSLNGDSILLSSFMGKVVYVDVWASWCGPCIAEIPHLRKLQHSFSKDDNIAFVCLSVDREQKAWQNMLQKHPEFTATHLREFGVEGQESIWNTYQISGVPRYILIDDKGLIVDADAPSPSSAEIEPRIRELLGSRQN